MNAKLSDSLQIWRLAEDLGLKSIQDPVVAVLSLCEKKISTYLSEMPACHDLNELLILTANRVGTTFEEITSDRELLSVRDKYLARNEKMFARLQAELDEDVFGITFRLNKREAWELQYVSVIDCRGREKRARSFFTKWHEIAHLITQTSQMRLSFRRTHVQGQQQDAEEKLMDVIAGRIGFFPPLIRRHAIGRPSFEAIEKLKEKLCPEASWQSASLGIVKAWPFPCLLLHAQMGLKKREAESLNQARFEFVEQPSPTLRAVHVTASDGARDESFSIHKNMRIPRRSVIHKIFQDERPYGKAIENLKWWKASDGAHLPARRVLVEAKLGWEFVDALVIPVE